MLRPNQDRAKIAIAIIYIILFLQIAFLLSNYAQYYFLDNVETANYSYEDGEANDTRQQFLAILIILVTIISAVTFIMWFRRAYSNLQLAGEQTEYTDGWAAGAWFVPILNLFRPYQMMKEIFVKSNYIINEKLGGDGVQNYNSKIGLWWACWLLPMLTNMAMKIIPEENTIEYFKTITVITMVDCVLTILSCITAILVVKLYKEQELLLEEAASLQLNEIGSKLEA